jgi:hypothetical protein
MHGDACRLPSFWIPGMVSCRSAAKLFLLNEEMKKTLANKI